MSEKKAIESHKRLMKEIYKDKDVMYYICEIFEPKHKVNEIKIRAKTRNKQLAKESIKDKTPRYHYERYVIFTESEIIDYLSNIKEFEF